MSHLDFWRTAALLCLGCILPASAQTPFTLTNSTGFRAEIRAGETVGSEQIHRAFLTAGTNRLVVRIPGGFHLDAANPERVVLANLTDGHFISMQLLPRESGGTGQDAWRARALRFRTGATVVDELTEFALNRKGPAYDLRWTQSGAEQRARVAFIPVKGGVLELSLLTSASQFDRARVFFRIVISSLQSDEDGPLVITPLPDFS